MKKTTVNGDVEMTAEEVAQVTATQADAQSRKSERSISALWEATDRYIFQYINGVGHAILSTGVVLKRPKAIACANWADSVWAEYYAKKAILLAGDAVDFDFTSVGPMPYSILELREECADTWEGL